MDELQKLIRTAFGKVMYPGDSNLRNSRESNEPFLLEQALKNYWEEEVVGGNHGRLWSDRYPRCERVHCN